MIRLSNHNQLPLIDPWAFLPAKKREILDKTWPGFFQREILYLLPAREFAACFNTNEGAPTKDLYMVLGALVLQQMFDLTDEETVEAIAFNIQWHYAFNSAHVGIEPYMCVKTLWNMRQKALASGIDQILFDIVSDSLITRCETDTDKQRIDSVHIRSNMARLGRLRLFVTCSHNFLKNLKRQRPEEFDELINDQPELVGRYLTQKAVSCFSMVKPSEAKLKLAEAGEDLLFLRERFGGIEEIMSLASFRDLCRVVDDQFKIEEGEFILKPAKEVDSGSMQNPSDPDAAYSGHKGQGYQAQVMETYTQKDSEPEADADPEGGSEAEPKEAPKKPNIITYVDVEPANESDADALLPALETTRERDLAPELVLADSLYGSDENVEQAKKDGTTVVAPAMGKESKKSLPLSDFIMTDGRILCCPHGHAPEQTMETKAGFAAVFPSDLCGNCPDRKTCPVQETPEGYRIQYDEKRARLAERRQIEKTAEFKDVYRMRSGVEATFSEMDRRTGLKHLRVRGLAKVRYCVLLKATGTNIMRAMKYLARKSPRKGEFWPFFRAVQVVKERFLALLGKRSEFYGREEKIPTPPPVCPPTRPRAAA